MLTIASTAEVTNDTKRDLKKPPRGKQQDAMKRDSQESDACLPTRIGQRLCHIRSGECIHGNFFQHTHGRQVSH